MLDPQVSPDEIKSREVELGWRVGLLSLQLFPNGGATDIVLVTLFCIAVGTAIVWYGSCCAALVFRAGAYLESSLLFPLVPVPNRPSRLRGR